MTSQMAQNAEWLPPVHPGEILNEEFLLPMNITQYRLAKSIGVDARRIHSIVHGERSITADPTLIRRATPKMRAKKPIRLNSNDA